ncbi:2-phosphosulfolactate phosphatase [Umezawaea beigongshangensis]|uniref:2-phosphosulfolactate phosphatase n=1 Tax=Umezawaea beigongshangensis TaxID=2780383 RepID=UPI0018F1BB0A|nr:2-phosphosulfolactate phosphatase [Umezawaea beigongshangensis]
MFAQQGSGLRLEWGAEGVTALGDECAVLVVVDVLVFTTSVDLVTGRGGVVRLRPWTAGARSARPADLVATAPGEVVETGSPNGAALCAAAAATGAAVLAGCLRNAAAVAARAAQIADGRPIGVVPAGERWGVTISATAPSGPLRPCVEDLLGAGAICGELAGCGPVSAEAALAAAAHRGADVATALAGCVSGRELIAAGHGRDVGLAAEAGVSTAAPLLVEGVFRA